MDPYRVLGVPPTATKEEIKAAFRRQALLCHPDRHASSSEAVKKQSEALFRQLNEAYQTLVDGSYRYRQTASPGRAGFQRGANPYANRTAYSSYYESASYEQGYSSRRGGFGFSFRVAHPGKFYRAFVDSGSLLITAVLAGLALAGIVVVEPIFSSVWEERNRGKLFKHIEGDVIERHRAQLAEIRAQRALMAQRKRGGEAAPPGAGFAAQGLVDHGGAQEEGLVQHGAHEGALMPVTPAQRAPASFDEGQGGRERSVEVHGLSNSAGTPAALPP